MKENSNFMKISELSIASGLPPSTIRYYIQEGLLPAPVKRGKTRAHYSNLQLEAIKLIKKKLLKKNNSLRVIKEELGQELSRAQQFEEEAGPLNRREEIIPAATELFLQKGYRETSIADIAHQAQISKETFYIHFRNKEELFMECADRIFHDMFNSVWQEIRNEKDRFKRIVKRGQAFYASYQKWIEMMDLVRSLAVGDNPAFKKKFKELLHQMIYPMIRELEYLKQEGRLRKEIDTTLAGYYLMGLAEYGASLINERAYSAEKILKTIIDIIQYGILN
ncbi:MAG: TetR family transcriptional regulator [Thermodesulfobacteriota bacterium]|jgi:AcrR family transcriptional regulator